MNYKIKQNGDTLLDSVYANRNLDNDIIDNILYSTTWEDPNIYTNMECGYELLMKHIKLNNKIYTVVDP